MHAIPNGDAYGCIQALKTHLKHTGQNTAVGGSTNYPLVVQKSDPCITMPVAPPTCLDCMDGEPITNPGLFMPEKSHILSLETELGGMCLLGNTQVSMKPASPIIPTVAGIIINVKNVK
jgi:hypothetical protein